jgi:hypothetical protein
MRDQTLGGWGIVFDAPRLMVNASGASQSLRPGHPENHTMTPQITGSRLTVSLNALP